MALVIEGSQSFACHRHFYPQVGLAVRAFTPQPQSVSALWLVLISRRAEGRLQSWYGWLGEILRWFARPKTVTHPSICRGNRTRNHRVSSRNLSQLRICNDWRQLLQDEGMRP